MNKLIKKFFVLSAMFSLMGITFSAFAIGYDLIIKNNAVKSQISFKEVSTYCIRHYPTYDPLGYGSATPNKTIDTKSGIFTYCGLRHSNVYYDIINYKTGKKIGTLTWYKPYGLAPFVNVYINGGKQQHFSYAETIGGYDLTVKIENK